MREKIDVAKLLCSWIKSTQYRHLSIELQDALKEQGLVYEDGKILKMYDKEVIESNNLDELAY